MSQNEELKHISANVHKETEMYGKNEPEDKRLSSNQENGLFWIIIPLIVLFIVWLIIKNPQLFSQLIY